MNGWAHCTELFAFPVGGWQNPGSVSANDKIRVCDLGTLWGNVGGITLVMNSTRCGVSAIFCEGDACHAALKVSQYFEKK
jgi:hypothetical protein